MVKKWFAQFRRGEMAISDAPRSGRPKSASDEENVEKVREKVIADRKITVRMIAQELKISLGTVNTILEEKLCLKKLKTKWVPRTLTKEQKETRVALSRMNLYALSANRSDFWRRFITVDETWVHHFTPESAQATREWTFRGEQTPTAVRKGPSAGKVMATVFWDLNGLILVDYLAKGSTITGAYYLDLLKKVSEKIRATRPGLAEKKSFSTKTTRLSTRARSSRTRRALWASIWSPTHPILQTWLPVTFSSSPTSKITSPGLVSPQMKIKRGDP